MLNFGISPEEFEREYFEEKPFLRRRAFPSTAYGSWEIIDRALALTDPSREILKVIKGARIDPSKYTESYIDIGIQRTRIRKDRLYSLLAEGASVVLNRIELVSDPMRDLCLQVGKFVGFQTTGNAYATLGRDPATDVHWDTHDVFVLQLKGRKHWTIYEPTLPLPMSHQISNHRIREVPEKPSMEITLEAGDALYVPRGWWHRVEPVEGSDTIHLTVAMHIPLLLDYIIWACSNIFTNNLELRKAWRTANAEQLTFEAVERVREVLLSPEVHSAFEMKCRARERVTAPFDIQGLLSDQQVPVKAGDRVTLNSRWSSNSSEQLMINGVSPDVDGLRRHILTQLGRSAFLEVQDLQGLDGETAPPGLAAAIRDLALSDLIYIQRT